MSSSDLAISVEGLHKEYTIAHQRVQHSTLAETALAKLRRPFQREQKETFHALTDLSFEINKGDVVGIIGRNGAGKSTLLKVLSQITEPTSGKIDLYGRVGSLLEVGTGFHPELTGRENIFLNGAILGMRRKEIERQFDAIVEFSDVEQFLDTPVKRYSSGMYVRLAFAVAAHLQPEILIVDEVLAVGDAEFQKKCLGKMKDVANSGRTVLFVSHHMQSVAVLCQKAMYLERGRLKFLGSVAGAVEHYANSFTSGALEEVAPERRAGTGELRFTSVTTDREFYECAGEKRVYFTVERRKAFTGSFFIACELQDQHGFTIAHCDSRMVGYWVKVTDRSSGSFSIRTPWLKPGTYRLNMYICSAGILDHYEGAAQLTIIPLLPYPATDNEEATSKGMIFADFGFRDEEEPAPVVEPRVEEAAALPV